MLLILVDFEEQIMEIQIQKKKIKKDIQQLQSTLEQLEMEEQWLQQEMEEEDEEEEEEEEYMEDDDSMEKDMKEEID